MTKDHLSLSTSREKLIGHTERQSTPSKSFAIILLPSIFFDAEKVVTIFSSWPLARAGEWGRINQAMLLPAD
jgi:hypothetical protein